MLVNQINGYIKQNGINTDQPPVILGNIGLSEGLGGNEGHMQGKIVLSLVNLMEEATLKNISAYSTVGNHFEIANPPVFLNLFLLFTANFTSSGNVSSATDYSAGLTRLSQIIEFLQSKRVFTIQNSPTSNALYNADIQHIKVTIELFSMTFEQINHLWGSLGGKQMPFVMYKAGILPVKRHFTTLKGAYIQDVEIDSISK